jgi:hypothetical protein
MRDIKLAVRQRPLAIVLVTFGVAAGALVFIWVLLHLPDITGASVEIFLAISVLVVGAATLVLVSRAQRRRLGPPSSLSPSKRTPPTYRSGTLVVRWFGSIALVVLLVALRVLPPALLAFEGVMLVAALGGEWALWQGHKRRFVRIGLGELLVLAVSAVMLAGVGTWVVLRPDPVFAIPSDASAIKTCPISTAVPDEGNQINSSSAGSTAEMSVGSKIYVADSPTGASALGALKLQGGGLVCAAGPSGFGEAVIAIASGDATLFVRNNGGDTYRISLHVS